MALMAMMKKSARRGDGRYRGVRAANPEDRVRALAAGYQNHIQKAVDANALAAAIVQLVTT
jgi:CheY-like chemotaxis protein